MSESPMTAAPASLSHTANGWWRLVASLWGAQQSDCSDAEATAAGTANTANTANTADTADTANVTHTQNMQTILQTNEKMAAKKNYEAIASTPPTHAASLQQHKERVGDSESNEQRSVRRREEERLLLEFPGWACVELEAPSSIVSCHEARAV